MLLHKTLTARRVGLALALLLVGVAAAAKQQTQQAQQARAQTQPTADLLAANFYSINKDGKTSARRIVQQPAASSASPSDAFDWRQPAPTQPGEPAEQSLTSGAESAELNRAPAAQNQMQSQLASFEAEAARELGFTSQQPLEEAAQPTQASEAPAANNNEQSGQPQQSGSFNQRALEDFVSPTPSSAASGFGAAQEDSAPGSRLEAPKAQKQFTTSTGAPISSSQPQQNSISMSLDGMMVNSRPRAQGGAISEQQATSAEPKRKANKSANGAGASQVARMGELSVQQQQQQAARPKEKQEGVAKVSRRVPYSGVVFSSPATKGQRTKPKASNQVGGGQQQQLAPAVNGISGPQAADLISASQLFDAQQRDTSSGPVELTGDALQMNAGGQLFRQPKPQPSGGLRGAARQQQAPGEQSAANANEQQQQPAPDSNGLSLAGNNLLQGFEHEEQQQQQQQQQRITFNEAGVDQNTLEVMRNLLANSARQQTKLEPGGGQRVSGDDMVMSVMSSADGKERRLVMIARDTLDSLQRYAAQHKQQQQQQQQPPRATKSKANAKSQARSQQQAAGQFQAPTTSSWWPESSTSSNNWTPKQRQQQEAQLQTTTQAPGQLGFGPATSTQPPPPSTTTTTTTLATTTSGSAAPTSTSAFGQMEAFSQEARLASTEARNDEFAGNATLAPATTTTTTSAPSSSSSSSSSTSTAKSTSSGDFREVPVETTEGGEQRAKQQAPTLKSGKANNGGALKSKQQAGGQRQGKQQQQQQASKGASGKRKEGKASGGSSGKQSGAKQQAAGAKSKAAGSSGAKRANQGSKRQQQQAVKATNAQQQPAAMMSRVFAEGGEQGGVATSTSTTAPTTPTGAAQQNGEQAAWAQQSGEQQAPSGSTSKTPAARRQQQQQQQQQQAQQAQQSADELQALESPRPPGGARVASQAANAQANADLSRFGPAASFQAAANPSELPAGDQLDMLRAAIPGEPQLDYPIHAQPPKTSFDCMSQSCPGGYYADLEAQCQVFHICQNDGRFDTFLCPNGTIFSQQHFVCVWWWQVDCQQSGAFYKLNDGIYCNSVFPSNANALAGQSQPLDSAQQQQQPQQPLGAVEGAASKPLRAPEQSVPEPASQQEQQANGAEGGSTGNAPSSANERNQQPDASSAATLAPSSGASQKEAAGQEEADANQQQQQQQQQLEQLARKA